MNSKTWSRLLLVARPELTSLLIGLIALIMASAAGLAFPQIVRWMVDHVLQPERAGELVPMVLGLFAILAVQAVAGSLRYYIFTLAGEKIVLRLRRQLYQRILSQDVPFFDFRRTGELMSRLSSDCATLQNTVSVNVSMGLRNVGQVVGGLGFMFYTSWRLSSFMLILIPPIAGAAAVFGKRIRKFSKEFQESLAEASVVAEETISGVRTVKSFVREEAEVNRYQDSLTLALTLARGRIRAITEFMGMAMTLGSAAICFVLWYGGREVLLHRLTVGDLTQFLLYLMLVAIGVGSLGSLWGDFMAGIGASQRVFEILDHQPEFLDGQKTLNELQGHIEFHDVAFHYPTRPNFEVLKNLSFDLKPGQVVALVGSSGGGKSTVASLIPRFYEPSRGLITLDGVRLQDLKISWLREQVGIVAQEPVLISTTIEENIRYGKPGASLNEVREAAKAANALEFIDGFPEGMQTRVGERGIQLSGGQKQRVAIARAVLKDPKILILDEATSNLDTASESLVQDALQRLMLSRTTLVIAHRLATVMSADVILVMRDGHIVQRGRHEELAQDLDGLYYQLLQRQFVEENSHASTFK